MANRSNKLCDVSIRHLEMERVELREIHEKPGQGPANDGENKQGVSFAKLPSKEEEIKRTLQLHKKRLILTKSGAKCWLPSLHEIP